MNNFPGGTFLFFYYNLPPFPQQTAGHTGTIMISVNTCHVGEGLMEAGVSCWFFPDILLMPAPGSPWHD